MKTQMKFLAVAAMAMAAGSVVAQTAGTLMMRAGVTQIAPDVTSSCMTAPDFGNGPAGCTKSDVSSDTQVGGGVTYMYTDHISVDLPLATPFKHKILGAGSMAGAGELGTVKALPVTVFLQYRFLETNAKFRPYVGLGLSYAYFYGEEGSGRLTATTNPGGPPTKLSVDSKFIVVPQIGATLALNDKWFIDMAFSKAKLNTTTRMSTGQTMNVDLDPSTYSIAVGYKF